MKIWRRCWLVGQRRWRINKLASVLELMRPSTAKVEIHGSIAVAESLRFLDWLTYDTLLTKCLTAMVLLRVSEAIALISRANEMAAGLPASVSVKEGLAAFHLLAKLNELRYVDPALHSRQPAGKVSGDVLEDSAVMGILSTLAIRYSMCEVHEMTPEFALLAWQKIQEEIAITRNVIFYSTEIGYKRQKAGKDKYKLIPRKSPYTPFWIRQRERMERPAPVVPHLVMHPGDVIDGASGKSLSELGEVSVQTEKERGNGI